MDNNVFRLDVHKMKCIDCDLIVLVEKLHDNRDRDFYFGCPICEDIMKQMDDITIKEETNEH